MDFPANLEWVELDLPEILAYKEGVLSGERPRCALTGPPGLGEYGGAEKRV